MNPKKHSLYAKQWTYQNLHVRGPHLAARLCRCICRCRHPRYRGSGGGNTGTRGHLPPHCTMYYIDINTWRDNYIDPSTGIIIRGAFTNVEIDINKLSKIKTLLALFRRILIIMIIRFELHAYFLTLILVLLIS